MKKNGFTMVEILITVGLLAVVFAALAVAQHTGVQTARMNIDKAEENTALQNAMAQLVKKIAVSNPDYIKIVPCGGTFSCYGDRVLLKEPIEDGSVIAGTMYTSTGEVKYGAYNQNGVGQQNCYYEYRIIEAGGSAGEGTRMLVKSIICPDVDGCNFNYTCEEGSGETYATCPTDCLCGNERCDTEIGEDDDSDENYCLEDCHCGNGACDEGETCATCPADCGACYSCFLAGTLITMADGSQKPIEDIIIGDRVLSFDEDTQQLVVDAVSQTFKHTSSHFLVINNDFRLTPNHPVLSNGQWIEAGMLRVGDTLTDSANQTITVTSIEPVNEEVATYNIEVNPYHTFIANRYIVHNKDPGPGDGDGDYGASFE